MERLYTNIIGTPVYEDSNMRPLTAIKDVIVDPDSGKIIAFVVNASKNSVIVPYDIISFGDGIHIHDHGCIVDGSEILRVVEVQKKNVRIFQNNVESTDGEYLGKVIDFSIDAATLSLHKIFVANVFLGLFRYKNRIIPAKNIVEILPNKIVVKDNFVKAEEDVRKVVVEDMALSG
ncbi:PRC-barrel domain-containing protein [Candidatus Peregrinibacteria bacterium]|nr:PRC-barrel domain-containing protein [Candidatus Peregrinibacteria bacterium]